MHISVSDFRVITNTKNLLLQVQFCATSRFAAHKTYNAQKLLRILRVGEDSDKEDIDELEPSMHEVDKDLDLEQENGQEENVLENEDLARQRADNNQQRLHP